MEKVEKIDFENAKGQREKNKKNGQNLWMKEISGAKTKKWSKKLNFVHILIERKCSAHFEDKGQVVVTYAKSLFSEKIWAYHGLFRNFHIIVQLQFVNYFQFRI